MSDHQHEPYDVYGLDGIRQDAREALALVGGLREDLGHAEERIRELEAKQQAAATALTQAVAPILATLGQIAEAITGEPS